MTSESSTGKLDMQVNLIKFRSDGVEWRILEGTCHMPHLTCHMSNDIVLEYSSTPI